MKYLIIYTARDTYNYDIHWRKALKKYIEEDVDFLDYRNISLIDLKNLHKYEIIILLHSADFTSRRLKNFPILYLLSKSNARIFYFPRNEHKGLAEKRQFIKDLKIDLVASQLPYESCKYIYGDLVETISLPHALNVELMPQRKPFLERKYDIGGRSTKYPKWILNDHRLSIELFINKINELNKNKFVINYSTKNEDRFNSADWLDFLNNCRFTVSSEAGAFYLDKLGEFQKTLKKFVKVNPKITVSELNRIFNSEVNSFPRGTCISPRHFESIGCGTCQILIEGHYNGILKPNQHYIELKKDFSNLDRVVDKMLDENYSKKIIDTAYSFISNNHTFKNRIEKLKNYF